MPTQQVHFEDRPEKRPRSRAALQKDKIRLKIISFTKIFQ